MENWNETTPDASLMSDSPEKQNRLATLEAHALRKRSHGHGIGWPERRTKGEGGRKRNGGLKGMQRETDAKNGNDHKAHGERKAPSRDSTTRPPCRYCAPRMTEAQ